MNLRDLLNVESRILFDFRNVLKYAETNLKYFVQILVCLECEIG